MSSTTKMFNMFDNNAFSDGFLDWMVSPEGILADQIRELTWQMLESVTVDTNEQRLVWDDGKALSIEHSAHRINETVEPGQGVTQELIESEILGWLEMEYVPQNYTEVQMRQFEQDVAKWVNDFNSQKKC